MSVSSEVQRTLVKSPPELWAELSDPTTLARHLGELGEIRIVQTEPDRAVDWEAAAADGAQASGRVEIEPSGWGTKVTLSAQRAVVEPEPEAAAPEAELEPEPIAEVEPRSIAESELIEALAEPELEPEIIEPAPRPGFFARLFRRHSKPKPAVEPEPAPVPAVEVEEPTLEENSSEEPVSEESDPESSPDTPEPDISAELAELEAQTTAVLTGVLDRLGAAHHRPFSRS